MNISSPIFLKSSTALYAINKVERKVNRTKNIPTKLFINKNEKVIKNKTENEDKSILHFKFIFSKNKTTLPNEIYILLP